MVCAMETPLVYLANGKILKTANQSNGMCAQPIGELELELELIVSAHINYIAIWRLIYNVH